jgi:hypothetical protein
MTSIFEPALGSDFAHLHPQIQRRLGFDSVDGIASIGRGVMDEVSVPSARSAGSRIARRTSYIRIGARRMPLSRTSVRLDRRPEDGEGPLTLEWRRGPEDRLKASFDRELGEILADGQVVCDQLVGRDAERIKDPLLGQIEGDDLGVDSPDTPADLQWAHPAVEEVAKELGPCAALRARAVPRCHAAGAVIPALGLGRVGDRCDRVSRVALVPDTERAR